MSDTTFDWKSLLLYIRERQVVPIIGAEVVTAAGGGATIALDRYVAEKLVAALEVNVEWLPQAFSLADVASVYLRRQRGDRWRLWIEVLSILEDESLQPSDALLQLAAIEEFSLFVTTTIDPLLARALHNARPGSIGDAEVLAYSLRGQIADLEDDWQPGRRPAVYHLFGRASASGDYVVTDEDRLEFIHALQSDSRQPRLLFDHLRDKHLLLLGCSFPDWLTRFFLRTLRRQRLGMDRDRYEAVADNCTRTDGSLVLFLNDCRVQVYPGGGTMPFIADLASRLRAQPRPAAEPAPAPASGGDMPYSVFLSYASEDLERVTRVKDALETAGIRVWFDQRALEPGDEYKEAILEGIRHCVFFFPCLSANSLGDHIRRFFRFEWNKAIEEAEFRDSRFPFIQPLILDDTEAHSERIPPPFREKRHMQRCRDGHPPPAFIRLTVDRLAAARQRRR
jgi:hypothetical protein